MRRGCVCAGDAGNLLGCPTFSWLQSALDAWNRSGSASYCIEWKPILFPSVSSQSMTQPYSPIENLG